MEGPRALDAVAAMTRTMGEAMRTMPEAVEDHAWVTAARLARAMAQTDPAERIERLCGVVDSLVLISEGNRGRCRSGAREELTAVRNGRAGVDCAGPLVQHAIHRAAGSDSDARRNAVNSQFTMRR